LGIPLSKDDSEEASMEEELGRVFYKGNLIIWGEFF